MRGLLSLVLARLNKLRMDEIAGVIPDNDATIEKRQINNLIIKHIDLLYDRDSLRLNNDFKKMFAVHIGDMQFTSNHQLVIIHKQAISDHPFPIFSITIKNCSEYPQILTKILINSRAIDSKCPQLSQELKPLASWDITLKSGFWQYQPAFPIRIVPKDAVCLKLRFIYCVDDKYFHPRSFLRIEESFLISGSDSLASKAFTIRF